jgi:hypothetical protein
MKTNKLTILISIFNFSLMIFLFTGSSSNDSSISIGNNCRIVDDGSYMKIIYDNTVRFILNKSNGNITAGSTDGTGKNTIYSNVLTANSVSGNLNTIPYLELVTHSGLTMAKTRGYIYMNSGKLILAYMDNSSNTYYYWIDLAQGSDINTWTYSSTEP